MQIKLVDQLYIASILFNMLSSHSLADRHWNLISNPVHERNSAQKCLKIPQNFTLCHGMQYSTMRLPNLLDHDSLDEAIQQSEPWTSLLRLHCHPDTRLFLCSLFAPICIQEYPDNHIKPCQSLCNEVQQKCEERMLKYGFPWPEMLNCSRFPADNDMCIKPVIQQAKSKARTECLYCSQVPTMENILDNFCRSSFVLKGRLKNHNETHLLISKKTRVFKGGELWAQFSKRQSYRLRVGIHCSCPFKISDDGSGGTYLVMVNQGETKLITPWKQDKTFKAIVKRFKRVNCNNLGREIRESIMKRSSRPSSMKQ